MLNNFRYRLTQFMQGRYGMDRMGQARSTLAFVLILLNLFSGRPLLRFLVLADLIYVYYRMLSKDIAKRYAENQKYLAFEAKVKGYFSGLKYRLTHFKEIQERNRGYHIYTCPRCRQKIRIPKGKGKIMVRCPRCSYEFQKRS